MPARAERVVSLDLSKIQRVLDVGLEPVGVPTGWQPPTEHSDWYARVAKTGTQAAPDVEAIAALRPDLVLGSPQGIDDALYARLSALAPTVVLAAPGAGAKWKELSEADAAAVGRADALTAIRTRYEARVAQLRTDRSTALRQRFATVFGMPGSAYALLPDAGPGIVLTDLGATFCSLEAGRTGVFEQLSYEALGRLSDAEVVLVDAQVDGTLTAPTAALTAQPTFTALPGRVAPLSHLLVFSYGEALALLDQLDDLLR